MTWISILLAVLSAIFMLLPGTQPLSLAAGVASLGLFGGEMYIDAESGHLTDDTDAHRRMLNEPDFAAADLYRAFDKRAASNRIEAERLATANSLLSQVTASDQKEVVFPEQERPVLHVDDKIGNIQVSRVTRRDDGSYDARGYDDLGREVSALIKPKVAFPADAQVRTADDLVKDIATKSNAGEELNGFTGQIITATDEQGVRHAFRVDNVEVTSQPVKINGREATETCLTITGTTADGRKVTITRSGATVDALASGESVGGPTIPLAELSDDPAVRNLLCNWMRIDPKSDPTTTEISAQDYAQFLQRVEAGEFTRKQNGKPVAMTIADLQRVPPGLQALGILQAAFGDAVSGDAAQLVFVGDAHWKDTSNYDLVAKRRPEEVKQRADGTVALEKGKSTISVGLVGVDYSGSSAQLTWSDPAGVTWRAYVAINDGEEPSFTKLVKIQDGKEVPASDEEKATVAAGFKAQKISGTTMGFSLDVETNGQVAYLLEGGRGSKRRDVDDFYATIHATRPANPIVARRSMKVEGTPELEVSGTRLELESDVDLSINNRRISHYVILGLRLLLSLARMGAPRNTNGSTSGATGTTETTTPPVTDPITTTPTGGGADFGAAG